MFEDLYMTEDEKIERRIDDWRDDYCALSKDTRVMYLDPYIAETMADIWESFIEDQRIISALLDHVVSVDAPVSSYRIGSLARIRELTTLALNDDQQHILSKIEEVNLTRTQGRAVPHPKVATFLRLILTYAMLTGNTDAVPDLANLNLWMTNMSYEPNAFTVLFDYIDEKTDTPLKWWLNLNGYDIG